MTDQQQPQPANLVDPNVPADQGLSSLGLIMQLGGSLFAAFATLAAFITLLTRGGRGEDKLWILLILGICVTRSLFQRMAGTELLYGKRNFDGTTASPLGGIKRYVAVGLAQSAGMFLIMTGKFHMEMKVGMAIAAGLAVWPATLAVLLMLPRFRRFSTELPVAEDKGFEGAAILMLILGTCGVLGTGLFLVVMLDAGGRALSQGPGVLIMLAAVMLLIRSCLHVQAGLSGLREVALDRSVELANRYSNFGVISAFCAAGSLLLLLMSERFDVTGLAFISVLCWMLLAWPLIVRRFFSERQFADLMAGDQANLHRRAPDAGLSGLGWLLFAYAMMQAATVIPSLLVTPGDLGGSIARAAQMFGGNARSIWFSAGTVALTAWAGYELIRMSSTARIVATIYSIVSIAVGIYSTWPALKQFKHVFRGGPEAIMMFLPMALTLVFPVITLILVNRKIAPTAQARFRTPPATT